MLVRAMTSLPGEGGEKLPADLTEVPATARREARRTAGRPQAPAGLGYDVWGDRAIGRKPRVDRSLRSFLALQGIDELLETRDLVQAHYNSRLAPAGVIVNRVERTVEHRAGQAEIASYF